MTKCMIIFTSSMLFFIGCSYQRIERLTVVEKAFTNQFAQVKATYLNGFQFIVRCEDGSIWEVMTKDTTQGPKISSKHCLFDPLYSLPMPSPLPTIPLEKP